MKEPYIVISFALYVSVSVVSTGGSGISKGLLLSTDSP